MKKVIFAAAAMLFANAAFATIAGSSHDFGISGSTYSAAGGGADCAYCHMPHNSPVTVAGAPLWSRNINYALTYSPYVSTVSGAQVMPATPNAGSRVCLSCHDGSQAIAVVFAVSGGTTNISTGGSTMTMLATSPAKVGPDMRNDHPVSIVYTSTATGNPFGLTASPNAVYNIPTPGTSTVECTSCHNAHNNKGVAGSYPNRWFMAATGVTDFCGGCHALK